MSHVFPLATTAEEALKDSSPKVRTKREANDQKKAEYTLQGLVHDWIRLPQEDDSELKKLAEKGRDIGFVQSYEDAETAEIVYAVTYWKLMLEAIEVPPTKTAPTELPKPESKKPSNPPITTRNPKKTKKRKPVKRDGRQLELFSGPDQQGYERRDPNNPKIILAFEEGDGTSFGH